MVARGTSGTPAHNLGGGSISGVTASQLHPQPRRGVVRRPTVLTGAVMFGNAAPVGVREPGQVAQRCPPSLIVDQAAVDQSFGQNNERLPELQLVLHPPIALRTTRGP